MSLCPSGPPPPSGRPGLDWGVAQWMTTGDGRQWKPPKALAQLAERIAKAQRRLARQVKGSGRWRRTRRRLARLYRRVARIREDAAHKLTCALVKTFEVLGIEDLNVQGMSASAKGDVESPGKNVRQKAGLNRAVLDACPGKLRAQLAYKAERCGRTLVAVDRFAATSKTCSECDVKKAKLALSERTWTCSACGASHDRDVNAAKNIERIALDMLGWPPGQTAQTSGRHPENCTPLAATPAAPA